jgi:hypothetical protein
LSTTYPANRRRRSNGNNQQRLTTRSALLPGPRVPPRSAWRGCRTPAHKKSPRQTPWALV